MLFTLRRLDKDKPLRKRAPPALPSRRQIKLERTTIMATPDTSKANKLGTIIHKTPLKPSDLPDHEALKDSSDATAIRPRLDDFIRDTLLEADAFVSKMSWDAPSSGKTSSPSTAKVAIGKRTVSMASADFKQSIIPSRVARPPSGEEFWYGRRSEHENAVKPGTASFEELDDGLRQDHSPKEAEYTPDVFDCVTVLDYATQAKSLQLDGITMPDLKVYEMAHALGAMLDPRVFAIAVVSGRMDNDKKFVVVQLPIDLSDYEGAMYSNGRNVREGDSGVKKKRCVQGYYASIERGTNLGDTTEWSMVTSSDARGNLPAWLQNMVAPGKVVHDVGLFMKWNEARRKKGSAT